MPIAALTCSDSRPSSHAKSRHASQRGEVSHSSSCTQPVSCNLKLRTTASLAHVVTLEGAGSGSTTLRTGLRRSGWLSCCPATARQAQGVPCHRTSSERCTAARWLIICCPRLWTTGARGRLACQGPGCLRLLLGELPGFGGSVCADKVLQEVVGVRPLSAAGSSESELA